MRPVGVGSLPLGYTRVEYLESTGAQWIDTGYVPNNETGIYLYQHKLRYGDHLPMGCRNSSATQTRFYALRSVVDVDDAAIQGGFGWGPWVQTPEFFGPSKSYTNYKNSRVAEGENINPVAIKALPFTPEYSIFMFAPNIGGGVGYQAWRGRIYEAEITQGEAVVMSFVPCLDPNNRPCMFDTVSKKPFYNATTGSDFLYG